MDARSATTAGLRRLRWTIVGASATALVLVSIAGANHLLGFGHVNAQGVGATIVTCDINASCIGVSNSEPGDNAQAVSGLHAGTSGQSAGVLGHTASTETDAKGVLGRVNSTSPGLRSAGVRGVNDGTGAAGSGVLGTHAGSGVGVVGTAPAGTGVSGAHTDASGVEPGVEGITDSGSGLAVGVLGSVRPAHPGLLSAAVRGINNGQLGSGIGVWGSHDGSGWGVFGEAPTGRGVYGFHSGDSGTEPGVSGRTNSLTDGAAGVRGEANAAASSVFGVYGVASSGIGVVGQSTSGVAVVGYMPSGGLAGVFIGDLVVTGTLTKGAGAFRIDHPLDPAHKYLQHSFVESPDMKNVYDGVVRTNARGYATVRLPHYFEALNRDFRYQLTILGKAPWGTEARVWEKVRNNRFVVRTSRPKIEVSWQVTGIRRDRFANAHRIVPELEKPASERGRYLNPELYGKARSEGVLRLPRATAARR